MSRAGARLFGTDGIRGPAGEGPLASEAVLALGRATAAALRADRPAGARPPRVLLGRDTRGSGPMVAGALAAGLGAGGAAVEDGGILSTPAVALLVPRGRFDLGVSVSASHNPPPDSGLKFLGPDGEKVDDAWEREVERRLSAARRGAGRGDPPPAPGRLRPEAHGEYVEAVVAEFRGLSLKRLRVVVDAAEGAASAAAPEILRRLGATVTALHASGNGARINEGCGALHPASAGRAVRRARAHLGLALDGDADRLTLLDADGRPRDGDDVLAALAPRIRARGRLPGNAVVGTVMSNGGLDGHLRANGVDLVRTPVGDRHVAAALRERGLALGAEPSGHILLDRGGLLTSDGVVSALLVMREMVRGRRSLSDLLRGFDRIPRAEAAVPVARKPALERVPAVQKALRAAREAVGPAGRLLVRYSGTEPKVRILVEGPVRAVVDRTCADLVRILGASLGGRKPRSGR